MKRKAGVQHGLTVTGIGGAPPTNRDINPTPARRLPYGQALLIPQDVGTSRILRTSSDYTNFVASRMAERTMLQQGTGRAGETGLNTGAMTRFRIRMCNCTTMSLSVQAYPCSKCSVGVQRLRLN